MVNQSHFVETEKNTGRRGIASSGDLPMLFNQHEEWAALVSLFHHENFPRSEHPKILQIMSELVQSHYQLAATPLPPLVAIWGSARARPEEPAYQAAVEAARLLAEAGFSIITGGGPGIMEAGNKGARLGGAVSVGLPMQHLPGEPPNKFLDHQLTFSHYFTRKHIFLRYASALVVFPGGYGTLDELFEALTLVQTRRISPIPIMLYDCQFWAGLLKWIQVKLAQEARTIDEDHAHLLMLSDDVKEIVQIIQAASPQPKLMGTCNSLPQQTQVVVLEQRR